MIKRNWKLMLATFFITVISSLALLVTVFPTEKAEATFQIPKVTICHTPPPVDQTMEVPITAVPGHLGHGDYLGPCEEPEPEPEDVCDNLEGIQEETPEGYVNEQGYCYIPEEPKDYCDTLEGVQAEDEDCPEVTPTPSEEPGQPGNPPTFAGSSTNAPVCPDGNTVNLPANPHVLRAGESATVNFFLTEGDSANIYWRVVGKSEWEHSFSNAKPNSDNFVSFTIHGLDPNLGYDFGVQQKKGCGGGQLVTAVVVDGPQPQLFHFSYWEWSK